MSNQPNRSPFDDRFVRMAFLQLVCEGATRAEAAKLLGLRSWDLQVYVRRNPRLRPMIASARRVARSTSRFDVQDVIELLLETGDLDRMPPGWTWTPGVIRDGRLTPWDVLGFDRGIEAESTPLDEEMEVLVLEAGIVDLDPDEVEDARITDRGGYKPPITGLRRYPGTQGLLDYTWTVATDTSNPVRLRGHALNLLHRRESHLEELEAKKQIAAENRKGRSPFNRGNQEPKAKPAEASPARTRGLRMEAVEQVRRELIGPKPLRRAPQSVEGPGHG